MGEVVNPFKIDGPACMSFSGGRSSAYMLIQAIHAHGGKLPEDVLTCFANTGKEDPRTLDFVQEVGEEFGVTIIWIEYRDDERGFALVSHETASRKGEPFEALIEKKKFLPNPVMRFCTSELKIKPIDAYLKSLGWTDREMVVGIRADEPLRIAKMPHLHKPLALAGISKPDVLAFFKGKPYDLRAEDGNCDLCFLKGVDQVMSSIRKTPEKAVWWAKQEEVRGARFSKDRPTYKQMRDNAINQIDIFGYEDQEALACFCGD
jgi:hypothetical protein